MALSSIRSLSIFAICGLFPIAYLLKDYKIKKDNKETPRLRALLITSLIVAILVTGVQYVHKSGKGNGYDELNATIDYALNNAKSEEIILYTGYNDGNLAEFRGLPSYIDTRAEVFVSKNNKKDDVMKEYYELQTGAQYYELILDKYLFTHIIITESDILSAYLPYDANYEKVYFNDVYSLYIRIK